MELMFSTEANANSFQAYLDEYRLTYGRKKQAVFMFSKQPDSQRFKQMFSKYIVQVIQKEWLRTTLKHTFYYEDECEMTAILQIASDLCDHKRKELHTFVRLDEKDALLNQAVDELMEYDGFLVFESFVRFRLRAYFEQIQQILEISIDEYKLEQQYQDDIYFLQNELAKNQSKLKKVYLLLNNEPMLYDGNFLPISTDLSYQSHPTIVIDQTIIAPLLSMAPEQIIVLTSNRERPIIFTLTKIFEERLQLIELTNN